MNNGKLNNNQVNKKVRVKNFAWLSTIPQYLADFHLKQILTNSQATDIGIIAQGKGMFGLRKSNPIPICGIPNNTKYLNRLRTIAGKRISYQRLKSCTTSNIEKRIDEYQIFNTNGKKIVKLYLCPYHLKTSAKAPEGFLLRSR